MRDERIKRKSAKFPFERKSAKLCFQMLRIDRNPLYLNPGKEMATAVRSTTEISLLKTLANTFSILHLRIACMEENQD